MPGKSRHGRKKHFPQGKKKKGRQSSPGVVAPQQAEVQVDKPAAPAQVAASSASTPVPAPTAVPYPYVLAELRRIGILAGILLAILVVLALVLP